MSQRPILLVDDDPDIQQAIEDCLTQAGFQVQLAHDGQEALECLVAQPHPALIILDLRMPRMDGLGFRTVQRARPELADIPVVVLTADREIEDNWPGLDAAEIAYKPLRSADLVALVKRHLPKTAA